MVSDPAIGGDVWIEEESSTAFGATMAYRAAVHGSVVVAYISLIGGVS